MNLSTAPHRKRERPDRGRLRRRHRPLPKFGQFGAMREKRLGRRPCRVCAGSHFGLALGQAGLNQTLTKCFPIGSKNLSLKGSRRGSGGVLGWSWRGPRAQMGRSSLLEPSWAPSWSPLGPFWLPLGPLSSPPELPEGPLGAVLGPSWAVLGPSWGHLGRSWGYLGPSWCHLGVKMGTIGVI